MENPDDRFGTQDDLDDNGEANYSQEYDYNTNPNQEYTQTSNNYNYSTTFPAEGNPGDQESTGSRPYLYRTSEYPCWCEENDQSISREEIKEIFTSLKDYFGFQQDSMLNIYDHFMVQLDSRASRLPADIALVTLHADYIGGENANYRKWYFSAMLDIDAIDDLDISPRDKDKEPTHESNKPGNSLNDKTAEIAGTIMEDLKSKSFQGIEYRWKLKNKALSAKEMVEQVALYLLIWGEANQVRFIPEAICFIFKLAYDSYKAKQPLENGDQSNTAKNEAFLEQVITPLYTFMRNQTYKKVHNTYVKRDRDHKKVIGYDDVNQLFWYKKGLYRIMLQDKTKLMSLPKEQRFKRLKEVIWKKVFFKTYKERRTWMHLFTNFNRIWIIHLSTFWYYTAFNSPTLYTVNYVQTVDNKPLPQVTLSVVSFGGTIACLIQLVATLAEWCFVPRGWPGAQHLFRRFCLVVVIMIINIAPSGYILGYVPLNVYSKSAFILSIVQFVISLLTFTFFASRPLGALFGSYLSTPKSHVRKYHASLQFTAAFPKLDAAGQISSYLLWLIIFACKFTESYYFLTLSLRDPIRDLSIMKMTRCNGERYFGNMLCLYQPQIVLVLMYLTDLILFFLDTYLWYIICNCIFSCFSSYKAGFSVLSPWKNQYSTLPKRIYTKILATTEMEVKYKPKILVSQIWNGIVITMYKEHILTIDHVNKLLYLQVDSEIEGRKALKAPSFFVTKNDSNEDGRDEYFPKNAEAERRISFFARSLASSMPDPIPVEGMPTFTVLVPHYGEKIILTLKEVIRETDAHSKLTLLEYLKVLYPVEWSCFVNDTRVLAGQKLEQAQKENNNEYFYNHVSTEKEALDNPYRSKILDMPFFVVGYKSVTPEFTLRTRVWASLRSQTLYRTISGFMNYAKALKLLYRVENPEFITELMFTGGDIESEVETMAFRKFRMVVSMQRYEQFSNDEKQDTDFLLKAYPHLQIAYLQKISTSDDPDDDVYYSCLIDGNSKLDSEGKRIPKYRIKLSGNPILGDGKADNQNHAIIFYRGEYIQVIDANQDHYMEECLKIRSVLAEFEEYRNLNTNPYVPDMTTEQLSPVAILGAREYIFSENSGVLGDVAAGKEQTFGTLFARTLAIIGGKLHYGHPDFLNAIFMTTRGGISKAQKELHLNEDIYAGMTAVCRGGRIKHCDYFQCGKGRDLGFGSILNFTTKIGAGMGEQLLSREYFYLGTQLPLDRFLSFYYAHAGFHINNLFIILSVNLFMCVIINLGALSHETIKCVYNKDVPITDMQLPLGCYNIQPVLDWVTRFVLSVFICFFIAFLPLILQEFTERGYWKAITRLAFHFLSLSPIFEVFVCQVYSVSLMENITLGGAKYISSGRGLATTRLAFSDQYSRFATISIYSGAYIFMALLFASISMWQPALLWFWVTTISLCLAPFIFNPHQFAWSEFFIDYRDYIRWLSRGNAKYHPKAWITFTRETRSRFTGYKLGKVNKKIKSSQKPTFLNLIFGDIIVPMFYTASSFFAYTFINAQNGVKDVQLTNSVLRLALMVAFPIAFNTVIILISMPTGMIIGSMFRLCYKRIGAVMATIAHGLAVIGHLVAWEVFWFLEGWNFTRTLLGVICAFSFQNLIFQTITIVFLCREEQQTDINKAWWDGSWLEAKTDNYKIILFFREFAVKIIELSLFALDFVLGHCLLYVQTPILLIPYIDRWHSIMLFWFKPTRILLLPAISKKKRRHRARIILRYAILYFFLLLLFLALVLVPQFTYHLAPEISDRIPQFFQGIIQPNKQDNNDTGDAAPSEILRGTPSLSTWSTMF